MRFLSAFLFTLALIAVSLFHVPSVLAWGPFSHFSFVCQLMSELNADVPRFPLPFNASSPSAYVGSDLPDGFYGSFWTASQCPEDAHFIHSPLFLGYVIQAAIARSDADLFSFALGLGSHVISDAVGFFPPHGFLGNAVAPIDWLSEFQLMATVDAILYQNGMPNSTLYQQIPTINSSCYIQSTASAWSPTSHATTPSQLDLLASVIQEYRPKYPTFPSLNATQLGYCTSLWPYSIDNFATLSMSMPESMIQRMIQHYAKTHQIQVIQDSKENENHGKINSKPSIGNSLFRHLTSSKSTSMASVSSTSPPIPSFATVVQQLTATTQCIFQVFPFYFERILNPSQYTPELAWQETQQFIGKLFQAGQCQIQQ